MNPDTLTVMEHVGEILSLIAGQQYEAAAKRIVELGLDLVPVDELRKHLDAAWIARANAAADGAERIKFGAPE